MAAGAEVETEVRVHLPEEFLRIPAGAPHEDLAYLVRQVPLQVIPRDLERVVRRSDAGRMDSVVIRYQYEGPVLHGSGLTVCTTKQQG